MRIALAHGGAPAKAVTNFHLRKAGAVGPVVRAWFRHDGVISQFYAALSVAAAPLSVTGRGNSATVLPVTSAPATATVTGAAGTPTYQWTRTDLAPQIWTINEPTSASATFTTNCDQGEEFTATFVCTATDPVTGLSVTSAPVTADCANIYYGGGYVGYPPSGGLPYP